tara:strand:+ start:464 stop:859 length:396 start_codon:yes stop_codon:yes gene_type:complete
MNEIGDTIANDFLKSGNFFNVYEQASYPKVNVRDNEEGIELLFTVPGVEKENLRVELTNGELSISAGKMQDNNEFLRKEFSTSGFRRVFSLSPKKYQLDSLGATLENGILKVTIRKLGKDAPSPSRIVDIQ